MYEAGGFMLPFLVVGSISTVLSIILAFTIPDVSGAEPDEIASNQVQLRQVLTWNMSIHWINRINFF